MLKPFKAVKDESPTEDVTDEQRRDPDRAKENRIAKSFAETALSSSVNVNDVSVDDDVWRFSDISRSWRIVATSHLTGADNSAVAGILVWMFQTR